MKVFIKNKFFSLGGDSEIKNENGEVVYYVKGSVFSLRRTKQLTDKTGKVLFTIKNKLFNWFTHKAYIYDANNQKIATVRDKFLSLKREYFVENYKDEIKLEGGFFSLTSSILSNGEKIGEIQRKLDLFVDSFSLEADEKNIEFLTALVIAIDNIIDNKRKED